LTYPASEHRTCCQAHVVNLDLQATLAGTSEGPDVAFPILKWIEKFGTLHLEWPHREWHLLLTLNATIEWADTISGWVSEFLRENIARLEQYRIPAERVLGTVVFEAIRTGQRVSFSSLDLAMRQRVLLAFVPKVVSHTLVRQGWTIKTRLSAEYSGANG